MTRVVPGSINPTNAVTQRQGCFPNTTPSCTKHNDEGASPTLFRSCKVQTLTSNRLFVIGPVDARSCSFVGTHEYVVPEIASGGSHGNAVDWWAFRIFIYEMIYGRTPFLAPSNEVTLRSIIKEPLSFLTSTPSGTLKLHVRNLISRLLNKDPVQR
ncbi:protein kinase PINOID-like [Carya illinoinensis]|uniref:protein kinase PINOID-like n=1 Tax=Carya illinoinensis TaxID=32201 RepID=UPI001C71FDF4|nr:protein kinase PINOID-like [Carya illinoinensis]